MMTRHFWLAAAVLFSLASPSAAQSTCTDNGADHGRAAVKTRPAPSPLPNPTLITVADVLAWPVPHVASFNDTDLIGAEEGQIIHLRAFVRLFKCEGDGDYHMEVADSGAAAAPRVIIEAPPSEPAIRKQLEGLLGGPPSAAPRTFAGAQAVPIEIWGWRFLDLDHQSRLVNPKTKKPRTMAQLKVGHAHGSKDVGTLWEPGHPILRVQP